MSDDLTGLQAVAGEFARSGLRVATTTDSRFSASDLRDVDVFGFDTGTRMAQAKEAQGRVGEAVRRLFQYGSRRLFKHNDSALRGNVASELRGALEGAGFSPIVYAPACPSRRRVVMCGIHTELDARGEPMEGGARTDLAARLRSEAGLESVLVDRACLAAGDAQKVIGAARCEVVIADAVADRDLDELVVAAERAGCRLFAGSIGLASAIARAERVKRSGAGSILVVAGSLQEATLRQVERLLARADCASVELHVDASQASIPAYVAHAREMLARGRHCVLRCPRPHMTPAPDAYPELSPAQLRAMRWVLGAVLSEVLAADGDRLDGIVVGGGMTARLVLHDVLGISRLRDAAWLQEGVTIALAADGALPGIPVITKSGGWGGRDALGEAVDALIAWQRMNGTWMPRAIEPA